jgi:8-oxo-dGTP diphosphatase
MTLQVGVKAVLRNSEGKILVLMRSAKYETAEGSWDIPGGRIDPGSSLIDNLAREIAEETGLVATSEPQLVAAQDIFFTNAAGEERHIVRLTYIGSAEGEPRLDGTEHTSYRWVSFDELKTLPNLDGYLKTLIDAGTLTDSSWK